jgi:hypothetical protein
VSDYLSDGTEIVTVSMAINPALDKGHRAIAINEGLKLARDLLLWQAEDDPAYHC